jgi:hypothetical protein
MPFIKSTLLGLSFVSLWNTRFTAYAIHQHICKIYFNLLSDTESTCFIMEILKVSCLFLFKHKRSWTFNFCLVYITVDPFLLRMIFRTKFQSTASGPYHQSHAMPIAYNWWMRRVSALPIILSISPPPISIRTYSYIYKYILVYLGAQQPMSSPLPYICYFCIKQCVCLFRTYVPLPSLALSSTTV